jgi:hypothetical protein
VGFVRVRSKILLKCHVSICAVFLAQMVGFRTKTYVPYAGKKLVATSKFKSVKNAGKVDYWIFSLLLLQYDHLLSYL